jgi:hypothetical protein
MCPFEPVIMVIVLYFEKLCACFCLCYLGSLEVLDIAVLSYHWGLQALLTGKPLFALLCSRLLECSLPPAPHLSSVSEQADHIHPLEAFRQTGSHSS